MADDFCAGRRASAFFVPPPGDIAMEVKRVEVLLNCLVVSAGGAVGTVCRYLVGLLPLKPQNGFPLITLGINVAGAFLIGLIAAAAGKYSGLDPRLLLFLKVGICGGFTTFSTFSLESVNLLQNGQVLLSLSYMALSVFLCVGAVVGAQMLVK